MLKLSRVSAPAQLPMIKSASCWIIALGLLSAAGPANATILWKGDFETGDLKQWDSTNLVKTGDRDNLVFVDSPCAEGKKCAKITLRDDIIFEPYNQSRVEVKHVGLHTLNGEDSYYAWSFMVPKDAEIRSNIGYWESTPTSLNTMTFIIEPAQGGGTNIKFGTGDLGKTIQWTAKLELNKWHRMAIHNHWSQGNDGKVDVWYDGVQVVTNVTATKRDQNKLFFQMGLHRSDPSPPVQDIYLDAAIEADMLSDILAPLPDPMGMGGAGGGGGMGGAGGTTAGGAAGMGGSVEAGMSPGGAAGGGAGGVPALGGMSTAGGSAGSPVAGSGGGAPVTPTSGASSSDSSGCALHGVGASGRDAWPLVALLLLGRRRRRA